jgi:hypothetical protein
MQLVYRYALVRKRANGKGDPPTPRVAEDKRWRGRPEARGLISKGTAPSYGV